MSSSASISLEDVAFRYDGPNAFELSIPELAFQPGESVAVIGPSGSGKTTLLGLLAGALAVERGRVRVDGTDLSELDDRGRRRFRIRNIGQVLQTFELLHYLSVIENVMLPHFIHPFGEPSGDVRQNAQKLLDDVGLGNRARSKPTDLSQGEQQRVAVCRALINAPTLLLADEPTGNLDRENKRHVVELLQQQTRTGGRTLVMATHDQSLLDSFSRVIDISEISGGNREPVAP